MAYEKPYQTVTQPDTFAMNDDIPILSFDAYDYSIVEVGEYVVQVKKIAKEVEKEVKENEEIDVDRQQIHLMIFYLGLVGDIKE